MGHGKSPFWFELFQCLPKIHSKCIHKYLFFTTPYFCQDRLPGSGFAPDSRPDSGRSVTLPA